MKYLPLIVIVIAVAFAAVIFFVQPNIGNTTNASPPQAPIVEPDPAPSPIVNPPPPSAGPAIPDGKGGK